MSDPKSGSSAAGALWAIGDIHGRKKTLDALFSRLHFDESRDALWLVGDLVNRGPDSLGVLRWARGKAERLGRRFACVLGNHDLHLVAMYRGLRKVNEDLAPVLEASDGVELVRWLRERPLLKVEGGRALVHAGVWPRWHLADAEAWARRAEKSLRKHDGLLVKDKSLPDFSDSSESSNSERSNSQTTLKAAVYAFTALRLVDRLDRASPFKGPPEDAPEGHRPWFAVNGRHRLGVEIVCGHWAALGLRLLPDVIALDSGVAWGGPLTACRLGDRSVVQQENLDRVDHP